MILGIIIASLIATALFRLAQSSYFPLYARGGLQPILFAVASVAIGFLIGWAEGVIFFIVYFFGGIVIGELTKKKQTDERACLEKEIENHLKEIKDGEDFLDRWTRTDRDGLVCSDSNISNIFYCPKCGQQNDPETQFNLSDQGICQSCLTAS